MSRVYSAAASTLPTETRAPFFRVDVYSTLIFFRISLADCLNHQHHYNPLNLIVSHTDPRSLNNMKCSEHTHENLLKFSYISSAAIAHRWWSIFKQTIIVTASPARLSLHSTPPHSEHSGEKIKINWFKNHVKLLKWKRALRNFLLCSFFEKNV